jgi:hypothetical protein
MLERYMAALCTANAQGVDIIIPLALPIAGSASSTGGHSIDVHSSSTYDTGAVHIQAKLWKNNFKTETLYDLNRGNVTTKDLAVENVLLLVMSLGSGDSSDFVGKAVAELSARVLRSSATETVPPHVPVVPQVLRCLSQDRRPSCMTRAMQHEMNAIRGNSDPLYLWREEQERKRVSSDAMNMKLKDFYPGRTSFVLGDFGPFKEAR